MNCEEYREQIPLYLYGELTFTQEEALERHVASCQACSREMDAYRAIHDAADSAALEAPPALLASCRTSFFGRLQARREVERRRTGWLPRFAGWIDNSAGWLKPVGAVALLAIGFVGGRHLAGTGFDSAAPFRPAAEVVGTRVRNVEADQGGRVRIVLEETRQRTVDGALNDQKIRNLLVSAAQDPADPGLRVESVDLLSNECADQQVRRALTAALERDPNPGVRLKALEALRPFSSDPQVRQSLSMVLLRDDNVGIRTQAIDLLTQHKENDLVEVLQKLMLREDNEYIRTRGARTLRDLNASTDSF
jgi:hypothetical protein